MLIDDYLPLEHLLTWVDDLSPDLDATYGIRGSLIPRWKNFFTFQVDRFDRYPEMITHGSTHICNVLTLAAEMLVPILESDKKSPPMSGEELFLLIASIFLHDIGMADVARRSQRPDEVRKRHSVLSGEMIRSRFRRGDRSAANLLPTFEHNDEVDVVAEICIHHQSKAPIAKVDRRKGNTAPTLEELLDLHEHLGHFNGKSIDICFVTALLRVLDACDVQYSRAGSVFITESKIRNNERLRWECRDREALSTGELRDFFRHYENYLSEQETQHFPKHSVIQKVWIIDSEVVYRPITRMERKLLCGVMPDAALDPEPFYRTFEAEVEQELSICEPYLTPRNLALSGVRRFDETEDPSRVTSLSTFRAEWTAFPPKPGSYQQRTRLESEIVSRLNKPPLSDEENPPAHISVFVAPEGSGKTSLAWNLARRLADGRRICYLPLGDLKGKDPDHCCRTIATRMTYFLAAWGDYLFYNKIRMEMEMEEAQWEILLERADQGKNLFIFDDMHLLQLEKESSPIFRFLRRLFERFGSAGAQGTVWVFSQRFPHPLTLIPDILVATPEIPPFSNSEIGSLVEKRKFIGFDPSIWPEGAEAVRALLDRYRDFPVVLDHIRDTVDGLVRRDADGADRLRAAVEHRMKDHVNAVLRPLEPSANQVLEWIQRYPRALTDPPEMTAERFGADPEMARQGRDRLRQRRLLGKEWPRRLWWTEKLWRLEQADAVTAVLSDIPELIPLQGLDQGPQRPGDAWDHTLTVVDHLRRSLEDPGAERNGLPFPRMPDILLLAGLLHDVGKPECREETDTGGHFAGHDQEGAKTARAVGVRLELTTEEIDALEAMVRHHMRPLHLLDDHPPTPKAVRRFLRDTAPYTPEVLRLAEADLAAFRGDKADAGEDFDRLGPLCSAVVHAMEAERKAANLKPLLTGKDLKEAGVPQGPVYREILDEAMERQRGENWTDRGVALAWLRERVNVIPAP